MHRLVLLPALCLAALAPARAEPPAAVARGAALFEGCSACHSRTPGETGKPGPNLAALAGRTVGADPDFDYSPALKAARAQRVTWDADRLSAFLADPEGMFPGTWMSPPGLRDPADRAALAVFLLKPR